MFQVRNSAFFGDTAVLTLWCSSSPPLLTRFEGRALADYCLRQLQLPGTWAVEEPDSLKHCGQSHFIIRFRVFSPNSSALIHSTLMVSSWYPRVALPLDNGPFKSRADPIRVGPIFICSRTTTRLEPPSFQTSLDRKRSSKAVPLNANRTNSSFVRISDGRSQFEFPSPS